ncbi:hypothetical protein VTH06DRAFT_8177, partial [Thermothelomyces fergusii]
METVDLPPKRRATSYADAVRGHRVLASKSKPGGGKLAGNSHPPKEPSMSKRPDGAAPEEAQNKDIHSAQKKGSMAGPKDNQHGMSQAKEPGKDSHEKPLYAKARDVMGDHATRQFSYAEAVKGKTLLKTAELRDPGGEHETEPAFPVPQHVPIPESSPQASPSSWYQQPDHSIRSSDEPSADIVEGQGDNRIARQQAWPDEASWVVHHYAAAAFFRQIQDHYSIEAAIQQEIMDQSEGRKRTKAEERDELQARLISLHDSGFISLWESQYAWDVLVTCGKYSWRVHHDILCRESHWFRARLPPKDPNGGYVTFNCDSHDAKQLANALYFMYLR